MFKISKRIYFIVILLIFNNYILLSQQNNNTLNPQLLLIITLLSIIISINLFLRLIRLRKDYTNKLKNNLFNTYKHFDKPIIIFDNNFNIEFSNTKLNELYNINLKGKNLNEIFNNNDIDLLLKNKKQILKFIDDSQFQANLIEYQNFQEKIYILILELYQQNKIFDKYHLLINNSSDGFYIFNSDARLIFWNKGAESITGYTADELFTQSYWDVLEKIDYDNVKTINNKETFKILFKQAIETENIPELGKLTEKNIVDKNGNLKVIQERCFIIPQNGSKFFCSTFRDFTERKKLEESLFESEKSFRLMLDNLPIVVFEANFNGELTYLNTKGFDLLDTNLDQFNNKINIYNFLDEENKNYLIKKIRENFRTQKKSYFLLTLKNFNNKKIQIIVTLNITRYNNRFKILGFAEKVDDLSNFIAVQNESIDYAFIYNNLPYLISFARLKDQTFYEVNRTFVNFSGKNKSEIIGKNSYELNIFENLEIRKNFFDKLIKNGTVNDFRFYYNHPELGKRLLSIDSNIVDYNNIKYIISVTRDITNLNDYLTSLEESEDKYRNIFELSPDVIIILQPNSIVLDINQRIEDLTGITPDKLIGKSFFDFHIINKNDRELVISNFDALKKGMKINPFKITLNHLDGSEKTAIIYGSILKNESGTTDKLFIIVSDITELEKAQKEIQSKQLLLENITNTTPMSIYIFTYDNYTFLWYNKNILELIGYSKKETKTIDLNKFFNLIHPDDLNLVQDIFNKKIDISNGYEYEMRILNSNKKWSWIYTKITPFKRSNDGNLEQMLGISYDITKQKEIEQILKKSEKELIELNATKDKFFTIISHDLRNPISSFLGLSELLYTAKDLTPPEIQAYGKSLNEAAHKIYQLLENLLQWSKIQTKRFTFEPTEINLKNLIDDIEMIFCIHLTNKKINLIKNIPENISVHFDELILSTILRNLVSNAIKFSYPDSEIIISANVQDKFVEISVQDSGTGMPDQVKNNLFKIDKIQSFEGTANEKGSGIGLLIIRDFLKSQNCEWDIISKLNEGTTFKFKLPLYN